MNVAQKSLQSARIIHIALLIAAVAYVAVALTMAGHPKGESPAAVAAAVGIAAFSLLVVAVFFRLKFVQPGAAALRADGDDTGAATKWRTGTIVSLVFAESIVMFGLVLRMIGVSWNISGVFYVVGMLVLVAWWPKLDLSA
jgi:F0F1-type ATP synthase membrane subunit c/vacuolar-type H+-ATPase subunit K